MVPHRHTRTMHTTTTGHRPMDPRGRRVNELDAARLNLLDQEARHAALLSAANHANPRSEAAVARWVADAEHAVKQAQIRVKEAEDAG